MVASIGNLAITASDVEREYRFELFLEGKSPAVTPDASALESACNRLIDQKLLAQESETDAPAADSPAIQPERLEELRKNFSSPEAFRSGLRLLGMDEQHVLKRLGEREHILRTIDRRLRPAARVEASEIEAYYRDTFAPEYARRGAGPAPPLVDVDSQIREILTQKKIDQSLAAWLEELKSTHSVRMHPF